MCRLQGTLVFHFLVCFVILYMDKGEATESVRKQFLRRALLFIAYWAYTEVVVVSLKYHIVVNLNNIQSTPRKTLHMWSFVVFSALCSYKDIAQQPSRNISPGSLVSVSFSFVCYGVQT